MNKITNKILLLFIITLILSLFLSLYKGISWLTYLNSLFTFSLAIFMIGLIMVVCRGGFLDAITVTFRRVFTATSNKAEFMKEDLRDIGLPSDLFSSQITKAFVFTGLILTLVNILIGYLI